MLKTIYKENSTSKPSSTLISNRLTLSKLVKITEESLVNLINKLDKEASRNNSTKETSSFLNLSNQGLLLTTENLEIIKTILTDLSNRSKPETSTNDTLKRILNAIDQINAQSNFFKKTINKYIEENQDYYTYKTLNQDLQERIEEDLCIDKIPINTWNRVYAETLKHKIDSKQELKFFLLSINRILNYSKTLIELIRKEINGIEENIKHCLSDLFIKRKSVITNKMSKIRLMIMQKSKRNLLSQIRRMNPEILLLFDG